MARHDLLLFLLSTATAGAGYSLLFLSALEVINAAAPSRRRGGVLSALYLTAYLSMGRRGARARRRRDRRRARPCRRSRRRRHIVPQPRHARAGGLDARPRGPVFVRSRQAA
ncbi:MAG: hypothetical protein WDO24_12635 [Pseudomonadota bacterium]